MTRVGIHRQRLLQRPISVVSAIGVQRPRLRLVPEPAQYGSQRRHVSESVVLGSVSVLSGLGGTVADGAGAGSSLVDSTAAGWVPSPPLGCGAVVVESGERCRHAVFLRHPQPGQGGGSRLTRVFRRPGGTSRLRGRIGQAGQGACGLPEGARPRTAGRDRRFARAQGVDEVAGGRGCLVVEELPVDHHNGGVIAGGVALDVFQGDAAVIGGLPGVNPEVILQGFEDGVTAHDRAQRVGAHPDQILAGRGAPVHGVERRHRGDFGVGQAQLSPAEHDTGRGEVTVFGLHQMQQR